MRVAKCCKSHQSTSFNAKFQSSECSDLDQGKKTMYKGSEERKKKKELKCRLCFIVDSTRCGHFFLPFWGTLCLSSNLIWKSWRSRRKKNTAMADTRPSWWKSFKSAGQIFDLLYILHFILDFIQVIGAPFHPRGKRQGMEEEALLRTPVTLAMALMLPVVVLVLLVVVWWYWRDAIEL